MRLASVFVCGCWTASVPEPPPLRPEPPRAVVSQNAESIEARQHVPVHSEWRGRYTCGQGLTGVVLAIDTQPDGEATATFEFGPLPENPGVPSGSYALRGRAWIRDDRRLEIRLEPERWIRQPYGYTMVAFTVVSDRKHRVLRGTMELSNCAGIEVKRM